MIRHKVLASSYLSASIGAAQYQGVNGHLSLGLPAFVDTSHEPANGFGWSDVSQELYNAFKSPSG